MDDPVPFYRSIDVFVLPSLWEGLPYAALEAMACGLPVAAFRIPGLDDLVQDGQTGLLADPGDEQGLTECIARLAADPALRAAMGQKARARILDRYTISRFLDRIDAVYRDLIRGHNT